MPPDSSPRYPSLQTPIQIGTLRLPHRVLMGSMHLNLETGDPASLAAFYVERARGGAALMVTGGAAVSRVGAGGPGYALINEPGHWDRWWQVIDAVHRAGGLIALQLFHAGRYAFQAGFGLRPVAPSAVYSTFSRCEPDAMSQTQIEGTLVDFATATDRGAALGFDAVEVMASEGYLLNQFASPVTNLRDDAWGGDAVRRRAFPLAVVGTVRAAAGSLPVIVRMSGADLVPGAPAADEVEALALGYVAAGADALDIGIGWHESRIPTVQSLVPHGVWVGTAARIKDALDRSGRAVPVIASNRINSLDQAEQILSSGRVDLVSMARPFLADPRILAKSFAGTERLVNTCIGCNEACIDRSLGSTAVSCLVNPRSGHELEFPFRAEPATSRAGRVAVLGAGPAGMEAARALAAGGAQVTLIDAGPRIGGQFLMAGQVPGKADFAETVRYFENELDRLGVQVRLGTRVESAAEMAGFEHVVVATGVRPRRVELPGADLPQVIDYQQAFSCPDAVASRVAIIGAGGIAVDLAHLLVEVAPGSQRCRPVAQTAGSERERFLAQHGLAAGDLPAAARQVTIMRRSGAIGAGMGVTTRWAAVQSIRAAGVRTLTGIGYRRIAPDGVWIEQDGGPELIEADTVIIAAGQEPYPGPAEALAAAGITHTVIGGALHTIRMNAVAAFEQGLRIGTAVAAREK